MPPCMPEWLPSATNLARTSPGSPRMGDACRRRRVTKLLTHLLFARSPWSPCQVHRTTTRSSFVIFIRAGQWPIFLSGSTDPPSVLDKRPTTSSPFRFQVNAPPVSFLPLCQSSPRRFGHGIIGQEEVEEMGFVPSALGEPRGAIHRCDNR